MYHPVWIPVRVVHPDITSLDKLVQLMCPKNINLENLSKLCVLMIPDLTCDIMVQTCDVMMANEVNAGKVENAWQLPV